eukprot:6202509-Pleurochrysis_carterae.AAC.3
MARDSRQNGESQLLQRCVFEPNVCRWWPGATQGAECRVKECLFCVSRERKPAAPGCLDGCSAAAVACACCRCVDWRRLALSLRATLLRWARARRSVDVRIVSGALPYYADQILSIFAQVRKLR